MDVSRIMRDLGVDQLVQLQASLEREIETKKEELRQMVGRRYRDVLDASNAVKRLTEISDILVDKLREVHNISSMVDHSSIILGSNSESGKHNVINSQQAVQDFVLLNAFLSQVGSTGDNVSDVFCLLLADAFYRKFASKAAFSFLPTNGTGSDSCINSQELTKFSQTIFDRLIVAKLELADRITQELGRETDWQAVAGGLAALAILQQLSVGALMDVYLAARLDFIFLNIKSSSTSLIDIIRMLRDTTQIIEDIFGPGEAIISSLRTITSPGWCPDFVRLIIDDQLCDYEKMFDKELSKINASYALNLIVAVPIAEVQEKCASWINQMCLVAGDRVRAMCDHFERTGQIVEFIVAINQLFKAEWSSIVVSNVKIYHSLFGDSILRRFRGLVDVELNELEKEFLQKFSSCNCNPMPLFQKRAVKFNALLASGVSQELNDLVQKMFDGMREVLANVNKYVSIGCEEGVEQLRDSLADSVLALVDRFLSHFRIPNDFVSGDEFCILPLSTSVDTAEKSRTSANSKYEWLSAFRLFLAFVQHEPSVFCLCMNRDTTRILRCNKILHYATEFSLCNFMEHIINECLDGSHLSEMPNICNSENLWMDLVEEFEHLELEGAGRVDVPNQLSPYYFQFLYVICRHINANSVGHLFTRNVTDFISKKLGSILASNLKSCGAVCATAPLICTQLLFDCKTLFLMFLSHEFIEAAQAIKLKLDPVDLKLLEEPLGKNAKLFAQRTSMIFGQLQAESSITAFSTTKENTTTRQASDTTLSASYVALVDITPKLNDIRRLTLIPRLSKLRTDEEGRRKKTGKQRGGSSAVSTAIVAKRESEAAAASGAMATGFAEKMPSAASLSSFYDKISTGWFKN